MRLGGAALVALVACAGAPAASVTAPGDEAGAAALVGTDGAAPSGARTPSIELRHRPVGTMMRPLVFESRSFEPGALALPEPIAHTELGADKWFLVAKEGEGYVTRTGRKWVAELEVDGAPKYRAFAGGGVPVVAARSEPTPPPCNVADGRPVVVNARWSGIVADDWTEDALTFEHYDATFDRRSCRAVALRGHRARAKAIVPGLLYAFRRCYEGCTAKRAGSEEVVFVAPPAEWVTSTADPGIQLAPSVGTLTRVSVPLEPGASSSAVIALGPTGLDLFDALRGDPEASTSGLSLIHRGVSVRADVVWSSKHEAPDGRVFLAGLSELP